MLQNVYHIYIAIDKKIFYSPSSLSNVEAAEELIAVFSALMEPFAQSLEQGYLGTVDRCLQLMTFN